MNPKQILVELEAAYDAAEAGLYQEAKRLKAMHGSVMPRIHVGVSYGDRTLCDQQIPRILVVSINQSRQGQEGLTDDQVRESMRTICRDGDNKFLPKGFGPRALAANLCRWILMQCGVKQEYIHPETIHNLIAYDNFVKWPFWIPGSKPPKDGWKIY